MVLTTHYLEEAEELCDRVAIMDEARIVALDTPAGLVAALDADARVSYTDGSGDHTRLRQGRAGDGARGAGAARGSGGDTGAATCRSRAPTSRTSSCS